MIAPSAPTQPMNSSRPHPPGASRLHPLLDFLLRAWTITRTRWQAKLALILVTAGVTAMRNTWLDTLVRGVWRLTFGDPIAGPDLSPWYGFSLIGLGVAFAIWVTLTERSPASHESPNRLTLLDRLERESVARCTARLAATIPSQDRLTELVTAFRDLPDLANSAEIPPAGRVCILTGPLGSGKSFAAERLFRAAVERARNRNARVPVYTNARHVAPDLKSYSTRIISQLGDPAALGAAVVVDQVDDLPAADARRLYEEAIALVHSWPGTGVLFVARTAHWLTFHDASIVVMREMNWDEAEHLMTMVSGPQTEPSLWTLPDVVRRSARRPLVAILLAGYLASPSRRATPTVGQLVEWMVRTAIARDGSDVSQTTEALLRALAVRLTDGTPAVSPQALTSSTWAERQLTETRLVNVRPEGLDFALPVLRQWFAFSALQEHDVRIEDVVADPERLDRWTDVIATAVELAVDEAAVGRLLDPIARSSPGVASLIMEDAMRRDRPDGDLALLPVERLGTQLRQAMTAFLDGLAPLGREIGPTDELGRVKPLGVGRRNGQLVTAWYSGTAAVPDVVDLSGRHAFGASWPARRSRSDSLPRGWAWLDARAALSRELERRLGAFELGVNDGVFVHELAWSLSMIALGRRSPFGSDVSVDDLQYVLGWRWPVPVYARRRLSRGSWSLVDAWLRDLVRENRSLRRPWPEPDRGLPEQQGGFEMWELYSPERTQEWLRGVLNAAIAIYSDTIETWFPRMGTKCERHACMPARLVAYLDAIDRGRRPRYSYYLERLPEGEAPHVVVHLDSVDHMALVERATEARPEGPVIVYSSGVAFGQRPATETALNWLSTELSRLRWTSTALFPE